MQLLNRKEFKEKLLDKYEISHGLSESDIDSMISRGFIPSVINEVGNEEYADHLINNEDAFSFKFQAYNKTKDFYTAQGLKDKLQLKDSSLTSLPENSLNELASRGLLKESDYYEVRKGEIYLFSPNLIYDVERLKNALEELDNQLEAEEQEDLLELVDSFDDEDEEIEEEKTKVEKNDDEEIPDDDFFDDGYDEKKEKKKERDRKRAKEKQQREKAAAEEARRKEYEEKLRKENRPENKQENKTEEQGKSDSGSSDSGAKQQGSGENKNPIEDEPKTYSQGSTDEKYKTGENGQANNTQGESNNYGEKNKSPSDSYDGYTKTTENKAKEPAPVTKTPVDDTRPQNYGNNNYGGGNDYNDNYGSKPAEEGSKDNTSGDTYSPKEGSSGENQYGSGKTKENGSEENRTENKTNSEGYKTGDSGKSNEGDFGYNYDVKRKEAEENKEKYEEQKAKERNSDDGGQPPKQKVRDEDGNFVYTGTTIGKTDGSTPSSEPGDTGNNVPPKDDTLHGTGGAANEPKQKYPSSENPTYSNKDTAPAPEVAPTPTSTPSEPVAKPAGSSEPSEPKESSSSAPETYKVVVPLSDGSYMTFEAVAQNSSPPTDNASQSVPFSTPKSGAADTAPDSSNYSGGFEDKKDDTPKTSYGEKKEIEAGNAEGDKSVHKEGGYAFTGTSVGKDRPGDNPVAGAVDYDDFAARAQAVFASKGVVLTSEGLNQIITTVNEKAGGEGFKVYVSNYNEDGVLQQTTVYDSKNEGNSFGDIYDGYMKHNNINKLPEVTPDAKKNDEKILNAVGVEYGGTIENNTYHPPSVPTINPLILNELQKAGVQNIEANGTTISLDSFIKATKGQFSYVEGTDGYYNAVVAQEQIKRAADDKYKSPMDFGQTNDGDTIKRAENAVAASAKAEQDLKKYASLDSMDSDPAFVPASLREKPPVPKETPRDTGNRNTAKAARGFGGTKELGNGNDYNQGKPSGDGASGGTKTKVLRFKTGPKPLRINSEPVGTAKQMADEGTEIKIDFSNPVEVENIAKRIEIADKDLAQELRNISQQLNGDIATVLSATGTATVDGSTLLSNPEMYINGKAESAEMVAAYIETTHPENAAKIRELSRELNGDVADVYAGKNVTDGETLLREPEKFIKWRAQDAEAVAKAIEERYPETAKKIRELSQKLNSGETATGSIFKQFGERNGTQEATPEELVEKAQKLLKNTEAFKGHAAELENIASKVERVRPDVAKQIREASAAVNGDVAKLFERAKKVETKTNEKFSFLPEQALKKAGKSREGNINGILTTGNVLGVSRINRYRQISAMNVKSTVPMLVFTEKDKLGRKHLTVITSNSDGTINIMWDANRKRSSVTLLGFASDINNVSDLKQAVLKGELSKQNVLASKTIRRRKLFDAYFVNTKDAQFALNSDWVKSRRQKRGAHQADTALDNETLLRAPRLYRAASNDEKNPPSGSRQRSKKNDGTETQTVVFKGLRGKEQRKADKKKAAQDALSSLLWYAMPTQEFNSTYVGLGYQKLIGRGSALHTTSTLGAALDAKDQLRKLNSKFMERVGQGKVFNFNGIEYILSKGKDRRALTKELSAHFKNKFDVDLTRHTATSLNKILQTGKINGVAIDNNDRANILALLKIKGMTDGAITISAYNYLTSIGITPFSDRDDKNLRNFLRNKQKGLKNGETLNAIEEAILAGKNIADLSRSEIIALLQKNPNLSPDLVKALESAKRLNGLRLGSTASIKAILEEINTAAMSEKFQKILKGVNISDLSDKEIKKLLKTLGKDDGELKSMLEQTLHLRKHLSKTGKLMDKLKEAKRAIKAVGMKMIYKLRGTYFGDGIAMLLSVTRTVKTAAGILNYGVKILRTMRASYHNWLSKGKEGSWRNAKHQKRKAKLDAKAERAQQKIADKAIKRKNRAKKKKEKALNRRNKFKAKAPKTTKKIKKAKNKIRKINKGVNRRLTRVKRFGQRISRVFNKLMKPFKKIAKIFNGGFKLSQKFMMTIAKYGAIFFGIVILLQVGMSLVSTAVDGVYSIVFGNTEAEAEQADAAAEESLMNYGVELCTSLDSSFKNYIEQFYTNDDVIENVKDYANDYLEERGYRDEASLFYDPVEDENLSIKRLGTTLNGIQTGIYFTYYNGDGEEVGYKSNAKEITALANAWMGDDFHAKGLFKSYTEKLWNYSHLVAYSPRTSYQNIASENNHNRYDGKTFVYSCPSRERSSECYENKYDYHCDDASANVYNNDSEHSVKTNIVNGVDKANNTDSATINKTVGNIVSKYTITNGIVEYNNEENNKGCQQHKLTYHTTATNGTVKNVTNLILNNGIWTSSSTQRDAKKIFNLPNGQTASIQFYSNLKPSTSTASKLPAPSGCSNWAYIVTAYKDTNGECHTVKAYYCKGCCATCSESEKKTLTSSMPTVKALYHSGRGKVIKDGYDYYSKGTLPDSGRNKCNEKSQVKFCNIATGTKTVNGKTYSHVFGTSKPDRATCQNWGTFKEVTTTKTTQKTYCTKGYCEKVTQEQTCTWKLSTYDGTNYAVIYNPETNGKFIKVRGQTIWAYKAQGLHLKVYAAAPSGWYSDAVGYVGFNTDDYYCSSVEIDGVLYVWGIYAKNANPTYGTGQVLCHPKSCAGHNTEKVTKTETTYYYCLGHERCLGYLKSSPKNITVNYCEGFCNGHTVEHYCTGHVDLNVAVVTLFLNDTNSLAYLGIPKEVTSERKAVQIKKIGITTAILGGNHYEYEAKEREVQTVPEENDSSLYLYNNAFNDNKFLIFDYEKFPLPKVDIELNGTAVPSSDNMDANPNDTMKWITSFIKDVRNNKPDGETKVSLNTAVSCLFSYFSEEGHWEDKNDALGVFESEIKMFNIRGCYDKFSKYHYFDGWFVYKGNQLQMVDGVPKDNGPYGRAIESTKDDWYKCYNISFPGSENYNLDKNEIDRMIRNMLLCADRSETHNKATVVKRTETIRKLLKSVGDSWSGAQIETGGRTYGYDKSGIGFASYYYQRLYQDTHSGDVNQFLHSAYNESLSFKAYSFRAKIFRKQLQVKSIAESSKTGGTLDVLKVQEKIKGLCAGDLLGAGDEVYVVIYNDIGDNFDSGHIICATVNGASTDTNDVVHLFAFTSEYVRKKSDLFWIFKCSSSGPS